MSLVMSEPGTDTVTVPLRKVIAAVVLVAGALFAGQAQASVPSPLQWQLVSAGKNSNLYLKRGSVEVITDTGEVLGRPYSHTRFTGLVLRHNVTEGEVLYFTYSVTPAACAKTYGTFSTKDLDTQRSFDSGFAVGGNRMTDHALAVICTQGMAQTKE